jgi:hypothetical protein
LLLSKFLAPVLLPNGIVHKIDPLRLINRLNPKPQTKTNKKLVSFTSCLKIDLHSYETNQS